MRCSRGVRSRVYDLIQLSGTFHRLASSPLSMISTVGAFSVFHRLWRLMAGNCVPAVDKALQAFLSDANRSARLDEIQILPFQKPVAQRA